MRRKKCMNCKHGEVIRLEPYYKGFPDMTWCDIKLNEIKEKGNNEDPRNAIMKSWSVCKRWEDKKKGANHAHLPTKVAPSPDPLEKR